MKIYSKPIAENIMIDLDEDISAVGGDMSAEKDTIFTKANDSDF